MAAHAHVPVAARITFLATAAAAAATVALTAVDVPSGHEALWWLAILAVPLLYRFPVVVTRGQGGIELGFESFVVIWFSFAAPDLAMVLWAAGWLLAQVPLPWDRSRRRRSGWVWLGNTAMTTLSGAAAILVITRLVPHGLDPGPSAVAAVLAGAAAFFLVDYVLTAVSLPLLGRASLREAWQYDGILVVLACHGGVAVLGYLGALASTSDPWAFPLIAVPVAMFIYASRGFSRASVERGRVAALLAVAARLHHATSDEDVCAILLADGPAAVFTEALALTDERPRDTVSAPVVAHGRQRWLWPQPRRNQLPYSDEDQRTLRLLGSMASDTVRRLALLDELERLAARDPLTGLANRATLQRALTDALASPAAGSTAVLFCDLDRFKSVNDEHGHDAGDQLLRAVSERMAASVRPGDSVARIGGDEFVVLLPGTTGGVALQMADTIRAAVRLSEVNTASQSVGVSIGVAVSSGDVSGDELLSRADAAMYAAKSAGSNQIRIAGPGGGITGSGSDGSSSGGKHPGGSHPGGRRPGTPHPGSSAQAGQSTRLPTPRNRRV